MTPSEYAMWGGWALTGAAFVVPLVFRAVAAEVPSFGESVTYKVVLRICADVIGAKQKRDKMAAAKAAPPMFPPAIPTDVDISEMDGPPDSPRHPRGRE